MALPDVADLIRRSHGSSRLERKRGRVTELQACIGSPHARTARLEARQRFVAAEARVAAGTAASTAAAGLPTGLARRAGVPEASAGQAGDRASLNRLSPA